MVVIGLRSDVNRHSDQKQWQERGELQHGRQMTRSPAEMTTLFWNRGGDENINCRWHIRVPVERIANRAVGHQGILFAVRSTHIVV
jgi:hypothetical protein